MALLKYDSSSNALHIRLKRRVAESELVSDNLILDLNRKDGIKETVGEQGGRYNSITLLIQALPS
ncbi:MAG: DUF2283 domain-containing protein [Thermoproteota archaeon]